MFQSFIDELVHAAGKDPVQFRVDLLNASQMPAPVEGGDGFEAKRALGVLQAVAARSAWDTRSALPKRRAMGVAFQYSHRGSFAEVADVTVDASSQIKQNWLAADSSQHNCREIALRGAPRCAVAAPVRRSAPRVDDHTTLVGRSNHTPFRARDLT